MVGGRRAPAVEARAVRRLKMNLGNWSGIRIALVAVSWPILVVAWIAWRMSRLMAKSQEGIVAVSGGIAETLLMLAGPPLILIASWLYLKGRIR